MTYNLIKKIHLYACLSTAAVLTMFILTSYLMIHHDRFNQESTKENYDVNRRISSESDWNALLKDEQINGRMTSDNQKGTHWIRQYASAEQFSKLSYDAQTEIVNIDRTVKSNANALVGIHRQRGYEGSIAYLSYAFLLDLVGISLIVFTITGVILWFKLLKKDSLAWIIFLAGFLYFVGAIYMLMQTR